MHPSPSSPHVTLVHSRSAMIRTRKLTSVGYYGRENRLYLGLTSVSSHGPFRFQVPTENPTGAHRHHVSLPSSWKPFCRLAWSFMTLTHLKSTEQLFC